MTLRCPLLPSRPGWSRFLALVCGLLILRGLAVLSLYPPGEGFDELQHIAYLTHLNETGEIPVLGETLVPLSVHPIIASVPHADISWRQTRIMGGVRYRHFWDVTPETAIDQRVLLFQAQHPPLFYKLTAPLYLHLLDHYGFLPALYTLRILQILIGALALALLLYPLRDILGDSPHTRALALVISLLPMYLIYILRVSNDALAVLFAALIFLLLARLQTPSRLYLTAFLCGLLLTAGAMTKTIAFLFLPVILGYFACLFLFDRSFPRHHLIFASLIVVGIYLAIATPYHLHNYQAFGTPFPALETIINAEKGHGTRDLLATIRFSDLSTFFFHRLVTMNLWTSGMTFLRPTAASEHLWSFIIALGIFGLAYALARPAVAILRKQKSFPASLPPPPQLRFIALCLLTVLFTFLGAYAHALNCRLAWGAVITPPYYVMVAYPAFLTLIYLGYRAIEPRMVPLLFLWFLGLLFLSTEILALTRIAVPYWAATDSWSQAVQRLTQIHPAFPPPRHYLLLLALSFPLLLLALRALFLPPPANQTTSTLTQSPAPDPS